MNPHVSEVFRPLRGASVLPPLAPHGSEHLLPGDVRRAGGWKMFNWERLGRLGGGDIGLGCTLLLLSLGGERIRSLDFRRI